MFAHEALWDNRPRSSVQRISKVLKVLPKFPKKKPLLKFLSSLTVSFIFVLMWFSLEYEYPIHSIKKNNCETSCVVWKTKRPCLPRPQLIHCTRHAPMVVYMWFERSVILAATKTKTKRERERKREKESRFAIDWAISIEFEDGRRESASALRVCSSVKHL